MTLIDAGEIQLDYERTGAGEPLLLIMGMSGTALPGASRCSSCCARDFDVIAYDHRGVGASTVLDGPVDDSLRWPRTRPALLTALELDSAHVMGISMGGMIAQELALAHTERLRTLTLGCTYCGGPGSALAAPEVIQRLAEAMMSGDRERALRTGWEVNVSASMAADEQAYARFREIAERARRRGAGRDGADAGDRRARHLRAPGRARHAADARDPRHRRSDAAGRERTA